MRTLWGQREPMETKWVVGWRPAALGMVKQTVGGEDVGYWRSKYREAVLLDRQRPQYLRAGNVMPRETRVAAPPRRKAWKVRGVVETELNEAMAWSRTNLEKSGVDGVRAVDVRKLMMGRSAGAIGRQTAAWGDLEGRMRMWVAVRQSAVRREASEMRRRKTNASRQPMCPRMAVDVEGAGTRSHCGSNQCRAGVGAAVMRGRWERARSEAQCAVVGASGQKRVEWRKVAAARNVRIVEEENDAAR